MNLSPLMTSDRLMPPDPCREPFLLGTVAMIIMIVMMIIFLFATRFPPLLKMKRYALPTVISKQPIS
jgi:hypothetical protein